MVQIRRKSIELASWDDMKNCGTLSSEDIKLIKEFISEGKSFIVVGGMGSGMTTFRKTLVNDVANEVEKKRWKNSSSRKE